MSEASDVGRGQGGASASLRSLREAQGLTIEQLAATIKVNPSKLQALEQGRYEALPDAAFARALAMAVCRALKVDPQGVLASLPSAQPVRLSDAQEGAVPFKPGRARLRLDSTPAVPWKDLLAPRWLAPAGVLLAAGAMYFWPQDVDWQLWPDPSDAEVPAVVAPSASGAEDEGTPLAAASTVAPEVVGAPPVPAASAAEVPSAPIGVIDAGATPAMAAAQPGASASTPALAAALPVIAPASASASLSSPLVLVASEASWVEVRDAQGVRVFARQLAAGETVGVPGAAPLSVKIGNAAGIRLTYQGNPIELAAFTRNNVARLDLK